MSALPLIPALIPICVAPVVILQLAKLLQQLWPVLSHLTKDSVHSLKPWPVAACVTGFHNADWLSNNGTLRTVFRVHCWLHQVLRIAFWQCICVRTFLSNCNSYNKKPKIFIDLDQILEHGSITHRLWQWCTQSLLGTDANSIDLHLLVCSQESKPPYLIKKHMHR